MFVFLRLFLLTIFFISSYASEFDDIDFITEIYPPYNFIEKDEKKGISVDLLMETLKVLKSNKSKDDIHFFPWVRGYTLAQSEKENNVLFSTTRIKGREKMFKWVGPIDEIVIAVISHKDNNIEIKNNADLQNYTYAAVQDDVGELLLLEKGVPRKKINSFVNHTAAIKMLFHKRVDMIAYPVKVLFWLTKYYGFNSNDVKISYVLDKQDVYYAFNLTVPDETVQKFQEAFNKVVSDELKTKEIYNKYLR